VLGSQFVFMFGAGFGVRCSLFGFGVQCSGFGVPSSGLEPRILNPEPRIPNLNTKGNAEPRTLNRT